MKLFQYDRHHNFKKIYKEKMKDRHKIKGIKFDYSKRDTKFVSNEKSQEKLIREYYDNLHISNYNKLKHEIFVREQKEKDLSKRELISKKYSSNFSYTNIMNLMNKFISERKDKSGENPFNYNLQKGKMDLEQINRNIKKNRINQYLKNIVLHYEKIRAKVETGIKYGKKIYLSGKMAEEIKNKILKKRRRNSARNYSTSKNDTNDSNLDINENNRKIILINNVKNEPIYESNYSENINESDVNNNFKISNYLLSNDTNKKFKKNMSSSNIHIFSNVINSEKQRRKQENSNLRYESVNNNQKRGSKYTYLNNNENTFEEENKNLKNKKLLLNSTNFTQYTNFTLNTKKDSYGNKKSAEPSELLMEDCNSIRLMKFKNNYVQKNYLKNKYSFRQQSCSNINNKNRYILNYKESPASNKNLLRSATSFKDKSYLKVINKPIYTTNINDLIYEYDRIKKNIKKLRKNYKEKHFSTYKEIDHLMEIKEDMLMFLLKQKFLNSKFRPKPIKITKNKNEFMNKMKDYVDMLEEKPRNYVNLEDLKF